MSFLQVTLIFISFRTAVFLVSYFSPFFIPYLGFFPYKEVAAEYNLPQFITNLANFDGAHYLLIARDGYQTYQQAFFPLYPLLIRWLSPFFSNNQLLTALFIANLAFLFGLYFFSKYLNLTLNSKHLTKWVIAFLLVFPTSFFFGAVYTEGLFFLFLAGTLYFLKKEKYLISASFAFLAALTKLVGIFLIIFFTLKFIENLKLRIKNYRLIFAILSPLFSLTIYMLYLWRSTGDPFFFLNSQWAFGAHRSTSLIFLPQVVFRYLKIFFTAQFNFQYFISWFEFLIFIFVLTILILDLIKNFLPAQERIRNYDLFGLNLFSLVNLILPTLTGTLSSIPRYALFSLSAFIYLGQLKNSKLRLTLSVALALLQIIILGFFIQGYFVS